MQVQEDVRSLQTEQQTRSEHPLRLTRRVTLLAALALVITHGAFFVWGLHKGGARGSAPTLTAQAPAVTDGNLPATTIAAHNLLLRKGPHFRLYVRWIQGHLVRTKREMDPSFDDPESFILIINRGLISIALKDLAGFLNAGATGGVGALTNVSVTTHGDQIELRGTAHKVIPLPVKVVGELSPLPDGRVRFHISGFSVMKVPLKGLLGAFHITLADLTPKSPTPGIGIDGNNFDFDTQLLLPPPHIHGQISKVIVSADQISVIYGNANESDAQLSEWHNFVKFTGGSLGFGKIMMNDVDLTMIDASHDSWFDLDLVNYQDQFMQGYSRITKGAGLEIYMPDANALPAKKPQDAVSLDWLKHRSSSLPTDVPVEKNVPNGIEKGSPAF